MWQLLMKFLENEDKDPMNEYVLHTQTDQKKFVSKFLLPCI
jgi:hypothetical protein